MLLSSVGSRILLEAIYVTSMLGCLCHFWCFCVSCFAALRKNVTLVCGVCFPCSCSKSPWELYDGVADSWVRFTAFDRPLSPFLSFPVLIKTPPSHLYKRLMRIMVLHLQGFDLTVSWSILGTWPRFFRIFETDSHYFLSLLAVHSVLTSTLLLFTPNFEFKVSKNDVTDLRCQNTAQPRAAPLTTYNGGSLNQPIR